MTQQPVEANVVLTADTSQYDQAMGASANQTQQLSDSVDHLGSRLDRIAKSAGRKMMGVGIADVATVTAATAAYAAYEKQMTSLTVQSAVLTRTVQSQDRLFNQYAGTVKDLRDQFGSATSDAAQLVQTLSSVSDNTSTIDNLANTFTRLGVASGESSSQLAYSMAQLQRTMGTPQRDTERFANQLLVLSKNTGASASSIMDFAQSIAPVGRLVGISQTDIQSFSGAFIKAGQDGYRAANVFNRMMTDIAQATQSGSPDLAKYANLVGMTVDQFKQLGGTEQFTSIFDAINRQGPRAITTLNQMGLDGMNTVRTITAMAQQSGGLQQAIALGRGADPNALQRGSNAALDTIVERLMKLRSALTQTGEAMGSAFAGPAKLFIGVVTTMAQAVEHFMQSPIGKLVAWATAGAGAFIALAGAVLLSVKAIAAFSAANMLIRNSFTGGFREAVGGRTAAERASLLAAGGYGVRPGEAGILGPKGARIAEEGNFISRGMYNAGARGGLGLPSYIAPGPGGTNIFSRTAGYGLRGANFGVRNFLTPQFMPGSMRIPGVENTGGMSMYDRRFRLFESPSINQAFARGTENVKAAAGAGYNLLYGGTPALAEKEAEAQAVRQAAGSTTTASKVRAGSAFGPAAEEQIAARTRMSNLSEAAHKASLSLTDTAKSGVMASTEARSLGRSFANMGMVIASAGGGLLKSGAGVASSALGALGGGPMLAMMGLAVGLPMVNSMVQKDNNYTQSNLGSGVSPYISATGGTPISATTSSFTLGSPNKPRSLNDAYNVNFSDYRYARNPQYQPVNTALKGMSRDDAIAYLAGDFAQIQGNKKAVASLATDVSHYFSRNDANYIMGRLQSGVSGLSGISGEMRGAATLPSQTDTGGFMTGLKGLLPWSNTGEATAEDYGKKYQIAGSSAENYSRYIAQRYDSKSGSIALTRGLSSIVGGFANNYSMNQAQYGENSNQTKQFLQMLQQHFGLDDSISSKDLVDSYGSYMGKSLSNKEAFKRFIADTVYGKDSSGNFNSTAQGRYNFLSNLGMNPDIARRDRNDPNKIADLITGRMSQPYGNADDKNSLSYRLSNMASGFVTQSKTFEKAINQFSGSSNAQYQAIEKVLRQMQGQNLNPGQINTRLTNLMAQIGNPDDRGYQLLSAARDQNLQRSVQFQLPYMNQTSGFALQTQQFQSTMSSHLGPQGREERQQAVQDYQQTVIQQYDFFKQQLYQQREYEVMRTRAQEDYNLQRTYEQEDFDRQRTYAEVDFGIQRQRAELAFQIQMHRATQDFNISRNRQEQDFQHQRVLMFQQASEQMYNIYQRIEVQRTASSGYLLFNAQEQLQAMNKQNSQLTQLRKRGLSKDAIKQFGLNDPQNAQQLDQIMMDVNDNPKLIQQFNNAVKKRLKSATKLFTNDANTEWTEFVRQYKLARTRAMEDFDREVARSHKDFAIQMNQAEADYQRMLNRQQNEYDIMMQRQADAYKLTMDRSAEDLARSARTIDGNFEQILTKAVKRLSGHAKEMAKQVLDEFHNLEDSSTNVSVALMQAISDIFGVKYDPPKSYSARHPTGSAHPTRNPTPHDTTHNMAEGGVLPGFTPGRDVHVFHSVTGGGSLALSGGEAVMRPEWTRAVGGEKAVNEMNRRAKYGQAFAGGGIYRPVPTGSPGGIQNEGGFAAVDIPVPDGTHVHAIKDARVAISRDLKGFEPRIVGIAPQNGYRSYGRYIVLDHGAFSSIYAHLSERIAALHQMVNGGNVIGLSGHTGYATGPHVHFGTSNGVSPYTFTNATTHYGSAGSYVGPGLAGSGGGGMMGSGQKLSDILQDRYPQIEKTIEHMQGLSPTKKDVFSKKIINRFAHEVFDKLKKKYGNPYAIQGGFGDVGSSPTGTNQELVRKAMVQAGWHQWQSLYKLIMSESGFQNDVHNPKSTAYGIFQFLDSTWAGTGIAKTSDPWRQSVAGMRYIRSRYGDPRGAWAHHQAVGTYGDGAVFSGGAKNITVGERGPEAVIPLNAQGANFITDVLERTQAGTESKSTITSHYGQPLAHNMYNSYQIDKSTNFSGPITVQANDPNQFLTELRRRQRTQALSQPVLARN